MNIFKRELSTKVGASRGSFSQTLCWVAGWIQIMIFFFLFDQMFV